LVSLGAQLPGTSRGSWRPDGCER